MNRRITKADEVIPVVSFDINVLPDGFMQSEIMNKIIVEIYNGWPGKIGLERVKDAISFISERIPQYAKVTEKSELETLEIIAKARRVCYTNWFQNAYLPDLSSVYVFDTVEGFRAQFPSGNYQCPKCKGLSTDFQECNSGVFVDKKKKVVCNWKVYGLFGGLGEEIKVVIKDQFENFPKPFSMFRPIELIELPIPASNTENSIK